MSSFVYFLSIIAKLGLSAVVIFTIIAVVCRVAWQIIYYVLRCKNPLGKTLTASIISLWVIFVGLLSII